MKDPLDTPLVAAYAPTAYAAYFFFGPWPASRRCRQIEGTLLERNARASFFVRAMPTHFALVRSCELEDVRPPILVVEGATDRFRGFADAEIVAHAEPLIAAIVQRESAGTVVDPRSIRVRTPLLTRIARAEIRGVVAGGPTEDCRRLDFDLPARNRRGSVTLSIAYDRNDILPKVPLEYQALHSDPTLLHQFRFALVRGCAPWNISEAPGPSIRTR